MADYCSANSRPNRKIKLRFQTSPRNVDAGSDFNYVLARVAPEMYTWNTAKIMDIVLYVRYRPIVFFCTVVSLYECRILSKRRKYIL